MKAMKFHTWLSSSLNQVAMNNWSDIVQLLFHGKCSTQCLAILHFCTNSNDIHLKMHLLITKNHRVTEPLNNRMVKVGRDL